MNQNIVLETGTNVESDGIDIEIDVELKPNLPRYTNASIDVELTTNSLNAHEFVISIQRVYDQIVNWRKTFSSFLLERQPKYL